MEAKVKMVTMNVDEIKFAPYNPRKISAEMKRRLKNSMDQFGYVEPIVVNLRTMHVVGGNQRLAVLKEMGVKEVMVAAVDLDEVQERALNLALNSIKGDWDIPKLTELLDELKKEAEADKLLDSTGFTPNEIAVLLAEPSSSALKMDELSETIHKKAAEKNVSYVVHLVFKSREEANEWLDEVGLKKYKILPHMKSVRIKMFEIDEDAELGIADEELNGSD